MKEMYLMWISLPLNKFIIRPDTKQLDQIGILFYLFGLGLNNTVNEVQRGFGILWDFVKLRKIYNFTCIILKPNS